MTSLNNIFSDIPDDSAVEMFSSILDHPHCKIERIVSYGQQSPEGFWYDQAWDEWVLLIQGNAELDLDGRLITLNPGDHLLIPARQRHRITKTDPGKKTVWLAVHLEK